MALGGVDVQEREPPQHARIAGDVRGRRRRSLRRRFDRPADALGARLRRAAGGGDRRLGARHRSHRKGLRVRRDAGAQRRDRGAARRNWAGPASTTCSRRGQLLPGVRAGRRSRAWSIEKLGERYEIASTDIKKWTVGSPIQAPLDAIEILRGKHPFEADDVERRSSGLPDRGGGRGQPRHPGHLPSAHGRRHADRQDGVFPRGARQGRACRTPRCCVSARK